MKKTLRIFDTLFIGTFLVSLFLPLFLTYHRTASPIEKRRLAPFPELTWDRKMILTFPSKFEAFFNDHFGFRDRFARIYYLASVMLQSSSNPNVLVGKEDWLFYVNPADGNSLADFRRSDPLTLEELRRWKTALEVRFLWLKQQGIPYLFVIAPDKHSIYSEYMPSRIRPVGKQSRLDQLLETMNDSQVPILDLRASLIQAKSQGLLYHRSDTHWNDWGAAVAQKAIMARIAKYDPTLQPKEYRLEDFSMAPKSGDLAKMLNLSSRLTETVPVLRKPLPLCERKVLEERPKIPWTATFSTTCRPDGPKALIFRDSFFAALQPYVSQYFSKTLYVWIWPDFKQVEQYLEQDAFDLVIEERAERSLKTLPALPTPGNKAYPVFEHLLFPGWNRTQLTD